MKNSIKNLLILPFSLTLILGCNGESLPEGEYTQNSENEKANVNFKRTNNKAKAMDIPIQIDEIISKLKDSVEISEVERGELLSFVSVNGDKGRQFMLSELEGVASLKALNIRATLYYENKDYQNADLLLADMVMQDSEAFAYFAWAWMHEGIEMQYEKRLVSVGGVLIDKLDEMSAKEFNNVSAFFEVQDNWDKDIVVNKSSIESYILFLNNKINNKS